MNWYALQVAPRCELIAKQLLEKDGFSIYVPLEVKWTRLHRRASALGLRRCPMIPGYVLSAVANAHELGSLLQTSWSFVHAVVGVNGTPQAIPASQIDAIRAKEAELCQQQAPLADWSPRPGEWAKIQDRRDLPLGGHLIEVREVRGRKAIGLLFGRTTIVQVKDLEPA